MKYRIFNIKNQKEGLLKQLKEYKRRGAPMTMQGVMAKAWECKMNSVWT